MIPWCNPLGVTIPWCNPLDVMIPWCNPLDVMIPWCNPLDVMIPWCNTLDVMIPLCNPLGVMIPWCNPLDVMIPWCNPLDVMIPWCNPLDVMIPWCNPLDVMIPLCNPLDVMIPLCNLLDVMIPWCNLFLQPQVVDIDQMIQERLKKVDRLRHSLQLLKNSCVREVRESQKVFSALVDSMEKSHKAVVTAIEERQGEEERVVEKLVKELEQEIQQLRNGDTDLGPCHSQQSHDELCGGGGQKSVAVSTTSTTGYSERRDWSKVSMETDPCMGVTRRAVSDLMDMVKGELRRLSRAVDISLSPKTAHAFLSVSDDRKQVRHTDKHQEVPDNPKRFDRVANVLGRESFSSGRFYWEVEVGEKIEWNLGVARQSINRKGKFTVSPANGFWTLSLKSGGQYVANTSPIVTPVGLEQKPRKVGVFLDYVEGRVSFYCAETGVHIHTFTDSFTDRLHPLFSPGRQHGGRNIAPLIISTSFCSI
uniref:Bloodthirsty-related gene family, member 2 n=1 Tax=Salmo trutta TaxID=8032 RepID=A0A673ZBB9_SALTR